MDVKFNIELNFKDYKDFSVSCNKKRFILSSIIYFLIFYVIIIGSGIKDGRDFEFMKVMMIFTVFIDIVIIGVIFSLEYLVLLLATKKNYNTDNLLKEMQSLYISKDGIKSISNSGNINIEWKDIFKATESKNAYFIFISANRSVILPKRYFDNEEITYCFKQIMLNNVDSSKIKFK